MPVPALRCLARLLAACLLPSLLPLFPAVAEPVVGVATRQHPLGPGDRFVYPLTAKVSLEGVLDEVKGREPTLLLTKAAMGKFGSVDALIDGDDDLSAQVWIAWTPDAFYVAAVVRDDKLKGGGPGPDWAGVGIFDSDTLLVSFLSGLKASQARYQESYLAMTCYEPAATPRTQKNPSQYVSQKLGNGYVVEGLLPFASLGWKPREGDWLNYYTILVDQDGLTPEGKRNFGQLLHTSSPQPRLRLAAAGSAWAGDLRADQPILPLDQVLYLSASLDALKPGGALREIQLLDADGKVVFQRALNTPLPAGQTTRVGLDLTGVKLGAGQYQAVLSFGPNARDPYQAIASFALAAGEELTAPLPSTLASLPYLRFVMPEDPPPYEPLRVTKDDYWELLRTLWPFYYFGLSLEDFPTKVPLDRNYRVYTSQYMLPVVLMYKLTGDPGYAQVAVAAMKVLDETTRDGKEFAEQYSSLGLAEMYELMKGSQDFPPEEDQRWRELIVREARDTWRNEKHQGGMFEYGNNNRGFWYLFRYAVALKFDPNVPEAKIWKPYVDQMWPYYTKIKDVDENTSGYGLGDPWSVVDFTRVMGLHDEYMKDPEAQYFHGRFAHELTAFGDLPLYGDGPSYGGSASLVAPFEHLAAVTRDGRYKWAAHRCLEYLRRFKLDSLDYVDSTNLLHSLAWALYFCDDTIPEVTPDWGSELLTRKQYTPGDWSKKFYWYMDENVSMPHKMVLRSGWNVDDMFAMVECAPGGGHAQAMPGALFYLARDRSLLLTCNPYQSRQRQNVVYLSDREGLADQVPEEISVPLFSEHPAATIGRLQVKGYQQLPASEHRLLFFLKNRFLVVKDRVGFDAPGLYDVFCSWHTKHVGLHTGPHWANTFIPVLENWMHIPAKYKTYDRDLLVYFAPQSGYRMTVTNHQNLRTDIFGPISVAQQWSGRVRAGEVLHFTTLLWPHRPQADTDKLLANFVVREDSPDRTVLEANSLEKDAYGNVRPWANLVMHNESGAALDLSFMGKAVRTDARYLILQQMEQAPNLSVTAVEATTFSLAGKEEYRSAERGPFDKRL